MFPRFTITTDEGRWGLFTPDKGFEADVTGDYQFDCSPGMDLTQKNFFLPAWAGQMVVRVGIAGGSIGLLIVAALLFAGRRRPIPEAR